MRPIFIVDQQQKVRSRPLANNITNRPVNKAKQVQPVVKSRLFAPKASELRAKSAVVNENKQPIGQKLQKKPLSENLAAKVELAENVKSLTLTEKVQIAENACKTAIEQAEAQLLAASSEVEFSTEKLDEAAEYCDRTESYIELFKFYTEMSDLAKKLSAKRTALTNCKSEYLNAMHEYSRFLTKNFVPFHDAMEGRMEKIQENIAAAKMAEVEEKEKMRLNPSLYKRNVELKEQSVQVRPESLIYYSPNAGVLRSTIKQRVVMPASPVLKTELTPNSSMYGASGRKQSTHKKPYFAVPGLAAANVCNAGGAPLNYCDDSLISIVRHPAQNSAAQLPSQHYSNSPFTRRLNFDDTIQELDNVTATLSKTTVDEFSMMSMTVNETLMMRPSIGKVDVSFAKPSFFVNKQPVAMPQIPVLLSDVKNLQ